MRRVIVNIAIVIALAALGACCYDIGKAYDVVFANTPITVGTTEWQPLEAVQVYIDKNGVDPVFLAEGDQMVGVAVGRKHVLTMQLLDENDAVKESRTAPFTIGQLGSQRVINVPLAWNTGTLKTEAQPQK